jgi:hypothetical protein
MNVKINEGWNLLRCLESTEENNPRASTNMDTGQSLDLGKIMDFLSVHSKIHAPRFSSCSRTDSLISFNNFLEAPM